MTQHQHFKHLHPISKELCFKIAILKSMMYCGVLWGLYHEGWAMTRDGEDSIFPFWLNGLQAHKYAQKHWPHYQPKKITPADFENSLLPTLTRLNVTPALCNSSNHKKLKLSTQLMRHFFFSNQSTRFA
ncbi:DUF2750 domain-containing protein [Acinetobacter sp. ANC 3813]|uniref:DUF2750 domain-containing protein n=1 Tax=Acinetobacter sp. ANC 3813 TaxID=1977873 RepID=UPI000A335E0B|nr:DUF2750 domain-containing protein [Acinetobacter sp. ANC 3813]OTG89383.1 hypothetical protein B9T34_11995 [Acinetobacter sp. ANC 3813]